MLYIIKQYEEELNFKLLSEEQRKAGYRFKFNIAAVLRGDTKSQLESLAQGVSNGVYTPNEARYNLDLPSKPGGDRLYFNGSNIPVEQAGEQYKTSPDPETPDTKSLVILAKSLVSAIMNINKDWVTIDGRHVNIDGDSGSFSSGGGYSFSSKVRPEVQQAFNEEYKAMTEKFGKISTITEIEPMTWADKTEYGNFNDSSGVLSIRFAEQKDCQKKLAQAAVENKQNGKWSSSHPNHVFRHEIGHAIQLEHKINDKNWNSKLGRVETIMSGIDKKTVSIYAFRDTSEFISECIAESMTKKARKTAKDVVSIILESD